MDYNNLFKDFMAFSKIDESEIIDFKKENYIDEEDGMHIWFGMVAIPMIKKMVEINDNERLALSFEFFEMMALSTDSEITEVLEFTVLENLVTNGLAIKCKEFMGEETLKSYELISKYLIETK